MATKLTGTKRQSYTVSDKLRIINFAEQHGNHAAEREFGVSESSLVAKDQGKLEKDASVETSESWQKSCMART